jgi:hypothetical protein
MSQNNPVKIKLRVMNRTFCVLDSVITHPLTVLQSGLRMICANDVTRSVASKPSDPWTSTDAPSYKHIHLLSSPWLNANSHGSLNAMLQFQLFDLYSCLQGVE